MTEFVDDEGSDIAITKVVSSGGHIEDDAMSISSGDIASPWSEIEIVSGEQDADYKDVITIPHKTVIDGGIITDSQDQEPVVDNDELLRIFEDPWSPDIDIPRSKTPTAPVEVTEKVPKPLQNPPQESIGKPHHETVKAPVKTISTVVNNSQPAKQSFFTQLKATPSKAAPSQSTPSESTPSIANLLKVHPLNVAPLNATPSKPNATPSKPTPSQPTQLKSNPTLAASLKATPLNGILFKATPSKAAPSKATPFKAAPSEFPPDIPTTSISSSSSDSDEDLFGNNKRRVLRKRPTVSPTRNGSQEKRPRINKPVPSFPRKSILDFFGKKEPPGAHLPPQTTRGVKSFLLGDDAETKYFEELKQVDLLKQKNEEASEILTQRNKENAHLENEIQEELKARLGCSGPETLVPSGAPHEPKIIPATNNLGSVVHMFSLEAEVKASMQQRLALNDGDQPSHDFFFFKAYYKPQKYCIPSKSVFKGWYSFLQHSQTPNDMIESGVLLRRIQANLKDPLPFDVWLWILHNIPASPSLTYARDQYIGVLTLAQGKLPLSGLLQALYALFSVTGANPTILSFVFNVADDFKTKSIVRDVLQSSNLPVLSTGHYYLPQIPTLEVVLETIVHIILKNETPQAIFLATILLCLAAVDSSLLYSYCSAHLSDQLGSLFEAVPLNQWEGGSQAVMPPYWRILAHLISSVISVERSELRLRLLEALNHGTFLRVHFVRHKLAAIFFVRAHFSSEDTDMSSFDTDDLDEVLMKSVIPILADPAFFSDEPPHPTATPTAIKLQFLQHALHHVPLLSVDTRAELLKYLNPPLQKLKRLLRVQSADNTVLHSVLDSLVHSIKKTMPIYDVYADM